MEQPTGLMTASIIVSGKKILLSELNSVFGLVATSTWKAKPSVVAQVPELDREEWRFENAPQVCLSFSNAIDSLIDSFRSKIDEVVSYCQANNLTCSVHIQLNGTDRSFILGFDRAATIFDLAKLGAELYIHTEQLRCLHSYESDP
jgi:hypothetical protein